jgi:sarcosine oxidase
MARMNVGVVGAGIFGLAAALELVDRGHRVTVLEREGIPGSRASSNDVSKVIRRIGYQHETYVELVERADRQWRIWQEQVGGSFLFRTGQVSIVSGSSHYTSHYRTWSGPDLTADSSQYLSAREARARYPQFRYLEDDTVRYDPWTGYLRSGQAVADLAGLAQARGIEIRPEFPVAELEETGATVHVRSGAEVLTFDRVVAAAGAWIVQLWPELAQHLYLTRNQMVFFIPRDRELFSRQKLPTWSVNTGQEAWYGFPMLAEGYVKVADDLKDDETHPEVERTNTGRFIERVNRFVRERMPGLHGAEMVGGRSCLYTNTPDDHFVIDWAPGARNILIAGCGSGHGFKFGGSIGPVIADALEEKHNPLGDLFRIGTRFG